MESMVITIPHSRRSHRLRTSYTEVLPRLSYSHTGNYSLNIPILPNEKLETWRGLATSPRSGRK